MQKIKDSAPHELWWQLGYNLYHKEKTGITSGSLDLQPVLSCSHCLLHCPCSSATSTRTSAQTCTPQVIHRKPFLSDHILAVKGWLLIQKQSKLLMSYPGGKTAPGTSGMREMVNQGLGVCLSAPAELLPSCCPAVRKLSSRWQALPTSRPRSSASSSPRQPPQQHCSPRSLLNSDLLLRSICKPCSALLLDSWISRYSCWGLVMLGFASLLEKPG